MRMPLKWTGSKCYLSEHIVKYFPREIGVFYEPFCGSAALTYRVLTSGIKVKAIVCSDLHLPLIHLWWDIQIRPESLADEYKYRWNRLKEAGPDYYYTVRNRFNSLPNSGDFLFLLRTCTMGLVRFNRQGEFNVSFHLKRSGMQPATLRQTLLEWSYLFKDVEFRCCDYRDIHLEDGDFIYLDPPYMRGDALYLGDFDHQALWEWMENLPCEYALSFDGRITGEDWTAIVPDHLYNCHIYLPKNISSRRNIKGSRVYVEESLYLSGEWANELRLF